MNYESTLRTLALADERLIVMTAENRAPVRNLPRELGSRFVDVGIAEQTLVGMASGLALRGNVVVAHALAAFLTMRAFEFIRTDAGIARLPVKLVGFVPGFLSEANGPTHQAIEDVALMRLVPGMEIFTPCDEADLAARLPSILSRPGPAYIRYPGARDGAMEGIVPPPGSSATDILELREGADATILTYGTMLSHAYGAAELLAKEGLAIGVAYAPCVAPIDDEALAELAARGPLFIVEDHRGTGGLHDAALSALAARASSDSRASRAHPIVECNLGARYFRPAMMADALAFEGFDAVGLAARIRTFFAPGGLT